MKLWSAAIMLFLIMDPLGNVPLFLSTLKHLPSRRRRAIIVRELVIAYGVMMLFLFFGQGMLDALQLKQESISIAGGIILFLIALKMIFPPEEEKREKDEEAVVAEPWVESAKYAALWRDYWWTQVRTTTADSTIIQIAANWSTT